MEKGQNKQETKTSHKVVAIILNFIFPGLGSIFIGKVGIGFAQLALAVLGLILSLVLIGIPLYLAALVWSIYTVLSNN